MDLMLRTDSWSCFKIKRFNNSHRTLTPEYDYYWTQMTMFIRWNLDTRQHFICVLDCPDDLEKRFLNLLAPVEIRTPYTLHSAFARGALELYDASVWSLRDFVRHIEKVSEKWPFICSTRGR